MPIKAFEYRNIHIINLKGGGQLVRRMDKTPNQAILIARYCVKTVQGCIDKNRTAS